MSENSKDEMQSRKSDAVNMSDKIFCQARQSAGRMIGNQWIVTLVRKVTRLGSMGWSRDPDSDPPDNRSVGQSLPSLLSHLKGS